MHLPNDDDAFEHLRRRLKEISESFDLVKRTAYHWQVTGTVKPVNYYPTAGRVYISGAEGSVDVATQEQVLRIVRAGYGTNVVRRTGIRAKRKPMTGHKRRLLAKKPYCHWCSKMLGVDTATVDHLVPLARGGSNRADNLVLACGGCNRARGSRFVEG